MDKLLTDLLKMAKETAQKFLQPLAFYTSSEKSPLSFHVLNVGEGLMVLIVFPDKTTMLYDCNLIQEGKDAVIKFLGQHIHSRYDASKKQDVQWIDVYVNSHRDLDHYRGLSDVHDAFEIKSIWDSGRSGETTQDSDYQYYMRLRRTLMEQHGNDAVYIPVPSTTSLCTFGGAQIYCLSSSESVSEKASLEEKAKIQHTEAIVLAVHYAGRSILLTSDSDWKAWKEKIIPTFAKSGILKATILLASHHGSRSFFTDEGQNEHIDIEANPETTYLEHIDHISPDIVLISCGDYEQFHHPNSEALAIYKSKAPNKQVYTTKEKDHFSGFIDGSGKWTVSPSRFHSRGGNDSPNFNIACQMTFNGSVENKTSGGYFPLKSSLKFTVTGHGGLLDPYDQVDVWWEVSNGGVGNYHAHQEIYYKDKNEKTDKLTFQREVAFEGTHLLRCRVHNKKKKIDITKIFVVNGYSG